MDILNYNFTDQQKQDIDKMYFEVVKKNNRTIIVIDDDPTGIQTVHDVPVYTDFQNDSMNNAFKSEKMFYILTNSRSLSSKQTEKLHTEIAKQIAFFSKKYNKNFILISRGDSTLRGHYPLETDTLRYVLQDELDMKYDGEIIAPAFFEGGRITCDDVHYVKLNDEYIPAGQTEFASDKTFGYKNSDLKLWIDEKTCGKYSSKDVISISISQLNNIENVVNTICSPDDFSRIILNATNYYHLKLFTIAFYNSLNKGKNFILMTAASLPKTIAGITDKPLVGKSEILSNSDPDTGGIIIIGSHVQKTTQQFLELKNVDDISFIEFNQHLVMDNNSFIEEINRVQHELNYNIKNGKDTVVFTKRERIDFGGTDKEMELKLANKISDAVTSFISNLDIKPKYIIAKGGITSSDIGTKALKVKKANVMGQILPGVPVWQTGSESKFPQMPYIIFPGNVGENDWIKKIVQMLR